MSWGLLFYLGVLTASISELFQFQREGNSLLNRAEKERERSACGLCASCSAALFSQRGLVRRNTASPETRPNFDFKPANQEAPAYPHEHDILIFCTAGSSRNLLRFGRYPRALLAGWPYCACHRSIGSTEDVLSSAPQQSPTSQQQCSSSRAGGLIGVNVTVDNTPQTRKTRPTSLSPQTSGVVPKR